MDAIELPMPRTRKLTEKSGLKFRSSCDACADSKVKCDKQRPHCARCLKAGHSCRYSLSLRMGKEATALAMKKGSLCLPSASPGHSRRRSTSSSPQTNTSPPNNTGTSGSTHTTPPTTFPDVPTTFPDLDTFDPMAVDDTSGPFVEINMDHTQDLFLDQHLFSPDQMGMLLDPPIDTINMADEHHPWFSLAPDGSASLALAMDDLFRSSTHSSESNSSSSSTSTTLDTCTTATAPFPGDSHHSCTQTAKHLLNILESLTTSAGIVSPVTPTACPPLPTHPPNPSTTTTIDAVLSTCSFTTTALLSLLSCPCPHDRHLPFLVAVIASKLLSLLRSAIAGSLTTTPSSSSSSSSSSANLCLGSYRLERECQELVNGQVVLFELRRVQGVAEAFADRYCAAAAGVERGGGGDDEAEGVYLALSAFLGARVKGAVARCRARVEGAGLQ